MRVPVLHAGKLEIMKLREDYKKKMGAAFNLQTFHDDFMRQGLRRSRSSGSDAGDGSPVL